MAHEYCMRPCKQAINLCELPARIQQLFIAWCPHNTPVSHNSMALCKTAVTPVLTHWSYCSLALSHWIIGNAYTAPLLWSAPQNEHISHLLGLSNMQLTIHWLFDFKPHSMCTRPVTDLLQAFCLMSNSYVPTYFFLLGPLFTKMD